LMMSCPVSGTYRPVVRKNRLHSIKQSNRAAGRGWLDAELGAFSKIARTTK
jgi:hypothetical protein